MDFSLGFLYILLNTLLIYTLAKIWEKALNSKMYYKLAMRTSLLGERFRFRLRLRFTRLGYYS